MSAEQLCSQTYFFLQIFFLLEGDSPLPLASPLSAGPIEKTEADAMISFPFLLPLSPRLSLRSPRPILVGVASVSPTSFLTRRLVGIVGANDF